MSRRLTVVPTIVVAAAILTMIGLGIWQLQRAEWKNGLLDHYRQAQALSADAPWPRTQAEVEQALYRHASVHCDRVLGLDGVSGKNAAGGNGWAHVARCVLDGGGEADIVLGWSEAPVAVEWAGGEVQGFIGPGRSGEARLIADSPLAGLEANARPDPSDLPNNHLSYAFQWFFFALTALVIYALALRKRLAASRSS